MTEAPPLPHRPRLADHVMLRRHIVDGEELIMLHDPARSEAIELEPIELIQLQACDGTRDIGGVVLHCVRQGAYQRFSNLTALLTRLQERGLLTDGIPIDPPAPVAHPERPLEVLAGYRLDCDQNGTCCTTYSSVPFTAADAERALQAVPDVLDGVITARDGSAKHERLFLPLYSNSASLQSVALVDGRCAFLADDNACRIHQKQGGAAKPRGCNIFPTTFVDDGQAVRVALGVECACALSSLGSDQGEALVPEGAACEAHLLPGSRVVRLPEQIAVSHERNAPRADLRSWSNAALDALPEDADALACLWSLADALASDGLNVDAAKAALAKPPAPAAGAMALRLMALTSKTTSLRESTQGWRSERDRTRRLCAWLDDAAQALMDQQQVKRLLSDSTSFARDERFYLRVALFGHQLVSPPLNLMQALRDRATRLLLARKAAECIPENCLDDPAARHPIAAVEAMMRGQGLADYAAGLP